VRASRGPINGITTAAIFKIKPRAWEPDAGLPASTFGDPFSSISIPILKALTAFAVFKAFTAFATLFKSLAALLALTAYEALAESAAIAALIETRTVPAVEVEAQCGFFDRVNLFES
jgi:hypothetical protein